MTAPKTWAFYKPSGEFAATLSADDETAAANLASRPGWHCFEGIADPASYRCVDGVLEPYTPPPPPAETLAEAKARKTAQIKKDGAALAMTRFPAVTNFDLLQLVQQLMVSVAPAARAPTADMTWLSQVWTAGSNARTAIKNATTIAQVDAVTPAWPAP